MSSKVKQLEKENKELAREVAQLSQQVEWLLKQLFGAGKGEKLDPDQLELGLKKDEMENDSPEDEGEIEKFKVEYERERKKKPRLSPEEKFAHIPESGEAERIIPAEVLANPSAYRKIDEIRRIQLDMSPIKFTKQVFIYEKYVPISDPSCPPIKAPAKPQLVPGSYATTNLIVQVIIEKYLYHMPLDRQEKKFARYDVNISRKTMCDWVGYAASYLAGIYNNIQDEIRSKGYVQIDETPFLYIDGKEVNNKCKDGRLWLINDPGGSVFYYWSLSRATHVIEELLGKQWTGTLQSDGYSAYWCFDRQNPNSTPAGCWAHVRRKFLEARNCKTLVCDHILYNIAQLYINDRNRQNLKPGQRMIERQDEDIFILNKIRVASTYLQGNDIAQHNEKLRTAVNYCLNEWDRITEYLNDGNIYLDNNRIENAVRPTKLGRKNFLFIGHKNAGNRTAIIYTIIENSKRFGINPSVYLNDVLTRLVNNPVSSDQLKELTPSNWAINNSELLKQVA